MGVPVFLSKQLSNLINFKINQFIYLFLFIYFPSAQAYVYLHMQLRVGKLVKS